jgi:uncharacterized protein (TIGR02266 family)
MDQARSGKRYATSQPLSVRCESWGEFVALYASDISQGGMFIVTDDPPAVLSEVDVQLKLPEGHEIMLQARVVHVIEPAQATQAQRDSGVGIEFVGLDVLKQKQIHQLIEFARWQGTSLAPTATLASHMFEMNASATPAQVMQSLAPPAGATPREAIPAVQIINGETASSGVRRASSVPVGGVPEAGRARASKPASDAPRKRRTGSPPGTSGAPEAQATTASGQPAAPAPAKPTDLVQLKIGMSHLAARRFVEAVKHFQVMLDANPGDLEVTKWMFITHARRAVSVNDEKSAAAAYRRVLSISEDVHEARKYLRELEQKTKLNSLPFGRFFVKKK